MSWVPPFARGPEPDERAGSAVGETRYTFMMVPEGAGGQMRQVSVTLRQLRGLLWVGAAVGALVAGGGLALTLTVPRSVAHTALVDENLALKTRLREIEAKLEAVDRELQRLHMYDTQLQSLPDEVLPGFGPLDADELAASAWMGEGVLVHADRDEILGEHGEPLDDHAYDPSAGELARADALSDRTDATLAALRLAEIEVGHAVESAEAWRARDQAMPRLWPLDGVLTSGFGWRRSPFTRKWKFHSGLDISAPVGSAIAAPAGGVVIQSGWNGGYGRMVQIDHGYGVVSRFAHNSRVYVRDGDEVERGQVISTVGLTGQTTGPHLHFEVYVDGRPVDPLEYLE